MLLKTFLASLAAKVAVGTGLAVATVSAAGAAGVLPEPAQNVVASVVEATTPFALTDPPSGAPQVALEDTTTTTSSTTSTTVADDDDDGAGGGDATRKENHGLCVSTVAKNTSGPDKGKTVSSIARSDCGKTSSTSTTVPTSSTSTSTTVAGGSTTTSTVVASTSASSGPGNSGNRGNSGNGGQGNSGKN
jgi:hypothetical protein